MKNYYSDTVKYWFKFYFNNEELNIFEKEKARINWEICRGISDNLKKEHRELIKDVYTSSSPISFVIETHSKNTKTPIGKLWVVLRDVEKKFAELKEI